MSTLKMVFKIKWSADHFWRVSLVEKVNGVMETSNLFCVTNSFEWVGKKKHATTLTRFLMQENYSFLHLLKCIISQLDCYGNIEKANTVWNFWGFHPIQQLTDVILRQVGEKSRKQRHCVGRRKTLQALFFCMASL